ICCLRASRTHCRKRFVSRCVEKGDESFVRQPHVVCTNVLRNASRLASHNVRTANVVEQRRFSVVNVTHDGHDRRTRRQRLRSVFFPGHVGQIGSVLLFPHGLEAELVCNEIDLVEVQSLIHRDHETKRLERKRNDLRGGNLDDLREFAHRNELVHANRQAFLLGLRGTHCRNLFTAGTSICRTTTATATRGAAQRRHRAADVRSEEHTSELQSRENLVCRLLLEKKKSIN